MRHIALFVGFALIACQIGLGQKGHVSVSLDRLIEKPQNFNDELVTAQGLLVIEIQPRHAPVVILYPGLEEASGHLAKNGILVIPSQEMIRSRERIDRRFVSLTGTFRAVRGPNGSHGPIIGDIGDFTLWSDPAHPVGEPSLK